jgi:hypothetical protein
LSQQGGDEAMMQFLAANPPLSFPSMIRAGLCSFHCILNLRISLLQRVFLDGA